jgi:hypothetical protein
MASASSVVEDIVGVDSVGAVTMIWPSVKASSRPEVVLVCARTGTETDKERAQEKVTASAEAERIKETPIF